MLNLGLRGPACATEARLGTVYRVPFRYRSVPQCFLKWRIPEFRNTKRIIWVRTRKQRDELLCCDRSATWQAYRYRQCKRCGRKINNQNDG